MEKKTQNETRADVEQSLLADEGRKKVFFQKFWSRFLGWLDPFQVKQRQFFILYFL
jgi:hypothetical protein